VLSFIIYTTTKNTFHFAYSFYSLYWYLWYLYWYLWLHYSWYFYLL